MGEFEKECMHWRGKVLEGDYAYCCDDWDGLPVDESCAEYTCCHCTVVDEKGVPIPRPPYKGPDVTQPSTWQRSPSF